MTTNNRIYLKFKQHLFSKKGLIVFLLVFGISFITISWTLHAQSKIAPVNYTWIKEHSDLWINIYKPCMYYRFRSNETAVYVYDWLMSEFAGSVDWEKGMQITSTKLSDAIILRSPDITPDKLKKQLIYWSVPHLGEKYAQSDLNNYAIIVRSRSNLKHDESHSLHYKISTVSKNETVIELWNYWSFH